MQSVLEKFPKYRFEIERLYLESVDFRELCQDYEEVRSIVDGWSDSREVCQATIAEYQKLLKDLETEIMDDLEARFRPVSMLEQNSSPETPSNGRREEDIEA